MNELKDLLSLSEDALFARLSKRSNAVAVKNSYVYWPGDTPLLLVAHIDTVMRKKVHVVRKRNILTNKEEAPLGADDRAGVYALLEVQRRCHAEKMPMPSFLFTCGEESGGVGAKRFCFDKPDLGEIHMMVEVDRRGCGEYVYYTWDLPKEVKLYVESFGFNEGHGSFSDISLLSEEYMIPAVNVSAGYYSEHSPRETLHFDELGLTINRLVGMLKSPIGVLHPLTEEHTSSPYRYVNNGLGLYGRGYRSGYYDQDYSYYDERPLVPKGAKDKASTYAEKAEDAAIEWYGRVIDSAAVKDAYQSCDTCGECVEDCQCGNVFAYSLLIAEEVAKEHKLTRSAVLMAATDLLESGSCWEKDIEDYVLYGRTERDRVCPFCAVQFGLVSTPKEYESLSEVRIGEKQTKDLPPMLLTPYSAEWLPDYYCCPACHGASLVTEDMSVLLMIALTELDMWSTEELDYDKVDEYLMDFEGERKEVEKDEY